MSHQEQAEQIASDEAGTTENGYATWEANHSCGGYYGCCGGGKDIDRAVLANLIRAALDAAAREALEQAAKELPTVHLCSSCDLDADEWIEREAEQKRNEVIRGWLKSRADSLSGRHEEETKR